MLRLRLATLDDCGAILDIYRPYVENTTVSFELETPSHDAFAARMRGILDFFPYLVAEKDGEIVGYAYAHFCFERKAYRFNAELSVYVKQGCTHSGVGSMLYDALIRILEAQGFRTLYAIVTIPNEASEALHRRFGFRRAVLYEKQGYKFGEWHDVAWFERRLCEPVGDPGELRAFYMLPAEFVAEILSHPYGL